jgi:LysM repeat protein
VGNNATRCLVCGTDLARAADRLRPRRRLYPNPFALALLLGFIGFGALLVLMASGTVPVPDVLMNIFPTPTITPTFTPLPTPTPTATASQTPEPTATTPPPIEYVIKEGDSCLLLAIIYEVTVESIIMLNSLGPECTIAIGHTLLIPHPTPTIGPRITAPPPGTEAGPTPAPYPTYVVEAGDTCLGIAFAFEVTMDDIMIANGIPDCSILAEGRVLLIPISPTPAPTATPTRAASATPSLAPAAAAQPTSVAASAAGPAEPAPTWPPPTLLAPALGQTFAAAAAITLEWSAVGQLRPDEYYEVEVEDLTCNCDRRYRTATRQTSLTLPPNLRPAEAGPHIFAWTVTPVRQAGNTAGGEARYEPVGAASLVGTFTWTGSAGP